MAKYIRLVPGHRLKNTGLYRADKSPKPSAHVLEQLWGVAWNTSVQWQQRQDQL